MGLFSFFKRKKNDAANDTPQIKFTVTVQNQWVEPERVILKGLENAKPNCYGHYLLNPEGKYIVRGKNPQTNRTNKREYTAVSEDAAIKKAEADGLTEPFEVTHLGTAAPPPTENQLEYAKDVGIEVPEGACKYDVSSLLTRYEENDPDPAPQEWLEYLDTRGWGGSSLIGRKAILGSLHRTGELRDRIAMYAYYIHQTEHKEAILNLDKDSRRDHYFAFADYALQNQKIQDHYKRWYDAQSHFWSTERTWAIYKDFKEYCGGKI